MNRTIREIIAGKPAVWVKPNCSVREASVASTFW